MVDMWSLDSEALEERVAFAAEVRNLIWSETRKRMGLNGQQGPATPNAISPTSAAAKQLHLVYLEVATEVGDIAQRLASEAAARAGRAGANYAELGEYAGGISRQAARKRWPDAVGTYWTLYLLTGKSHPHGMSVSVFRSSGKAIDAAELPWTTEPSPTTAPSPPRSSTPPVTPCGPAPSTTAPGRRRKSPCPRSCRPFPHRPGRAHRLAAPVGAAHHQALNAHVTGCRAVQAAAEHARSRGDDGCRARGSLSHARPGVLRTRSTTAAVAGLGPYGDTKR